MRGEYVTLATENASTKTDVVGQDECSEIVKDGIMENLRLQINLNKYPETAKRLEPGVSPAMVDWALTTLLSGFESDPSELWCDEEDRRNGPAAPKPDPDSGTAQNLGSEGSDPSVLTRFLNSYWESVEDCVEGDADSRDDWSESDWFDEEPSEEDWFEDYWPKGDSGAILKVE